MILNWLRAYWLLVRRPWTDEERAEWQGFGF
jgi:hypothetical protein